MPCYWSTNADKICARFECFAWSHESLLIVRLRPAWANSLNRDFDLAAESRSEERGRVGRERGRLDRLFSRPPSEPDVQLAPHPALQFLDADRRLAIRATHPP